MPKIYLDEISLVSGLLAVILLFLIIVGIRRFLRISRESRKQSSDQGQERKIDSTQQKYFSRYFLYAQHQHLAHLLFPLVDILIEPRFLLPPPALDPLAPPFFERASDQIIPFNPLWPELISQYDVRNYSLKEILANNVSVAIVGEPGSGKSTALVSLLLKYVDIHRANIENSEKIPVYLHINDCNYQSYDPENPFDSISLAVCELFKTEFKKDVVDFINFNLQKSNIILLLDGLDELSLSELESALAYIRDLMKKYPRLIFVTTINQENSTLLYDLRFRLAFIGAWNKKTIKEYLQKWFVSWERISLEIEKNQQTSLIQTTLLNSFLGDENSIHTPFEWTFIIWGFLSNDIFETDPYSLLRSYIVRSFENREIPTDLAKFCYSFIVENHSAFSQPPYQEIDIFKKTLRGSFRISHPIIAGYLACNFYPITSREFNYDIFQWVYSNTWLYFSSSDDLIREIASRYDSKSDIPAYLQLQKISRLAINPNIQSTARGTILLEIYRLIQKNDLPLGLRLGVLSGYILSKDRTNINLIKQLFQSQIASVRQMAALTAGFVNDNIFESDLIHLINDATIDTRGAALFGLSLLNRASALQSIVDALFSGDEYIKRMAAEALAMMPSQGHAVLKEACRTNDLSVRKASIYGLSNIHENWVDELLAKISVEDNQWIVRDTAVQAIEARTNPDPFLPRRLPIAADASWLIQIASSRGEGISRSELPYSLLLDTLATGSFEEQMASLDYLVDLSKKNVFDEVYKKFSDEENMIREKASFLIWLYSNRKFARVRRL